MMNAEEDFNLAKVKEEEEDFDCQACQDGFAECDITESQPCQAPVEVVRIKVEEVTDYGLSQAKGTQLECAEAEGKGYFDSSDYQEEDLDPSVDQTLFKNRSRSRRLRRNVKGCGLLSFIGYKTSVHRVETDQATGTLGPKKVKERKRSRHFKCTFCDRRFRGKKELARHAEAHFTGRKEMVSTEVRYSDQGYRPRHVEVGDFQCEVCAMQFTRINYLKRHMRSHTGEKPYSCDVCGKLYVCATGLHRHWRKHTGERPFQCLFCDKTFAIKHSLKRHHASHTGEKPFECQVCGQRFSRRYHLTSHARNLHVEEEREIAWTDSTADEKPATSTRSA